MNEYSRESRERIERERKKSRKRNGKIRQEEGRRRRKGGGRTERHRKKETTIGYRLQCRAEQCYTRVCVCVCGKRRKENLQLIFRPLLLLLPLPPLIT